MDSITYPADFSLDPIRQSWILQGESISLTGTEFPILCFLIENRGRAVPSQELSDAVWQDEVYVAREDCLTVHVKHIREKLYDRKPFATVKTVWGKDYWVE